MSLDIGATPVTGISASALFLLRKALGLEEKSIRVIEPGQMLGTVDEDVRSALGVDTVGLWRRKNNMGVLNENWKQWTMPSDNTPVEMAGGFAWDELDNGDIVAYPQGDKSVPPSLIMSKNAPFFSGIHRAPPIDEDDLDAVRDYGEQFAVMTDEDALYLEKESNRLYEETEYSIVGNFACGLFGDAGALTGNALKEVRGIRALDDWMVAHILYPDYIHQLFAYQLEIALKNLEIYKQAVGDKISVLYSIGTDLGTQKSEIISPEQYRTLYMPYITKFTEWIHKNTGWKVMMHSCGSIVGHLDSLWESGIDILNPVQCSAAGMDPNMLKKKYGDKFIFWGGGVDTQQTLPYGTVDEVRTEVENRIKVLGKDGGFVFNTTHNIVAGTCIDNVIAMYETLNRIRGYSR
jgi:hypothetical protein